MFALLKAPMATSDVGRTLLGITEKEVAEAAGTAGKLLAPKSTAPTSTDRTQGYLMVWPLSLEVDPWWIPSVNERRRTAKAVRLDF